MTHDGRSRLAHTVELMADRGFDALVVYSDGTFNILYASPLRYFAGFAPMGPHNAALVTRGGDVILLVQPAWDARRAKGHSWIEDVRGVSDMAAALAAAVRESGVKGVIGVAGGHTMPAPIYHAIAAQAAVEGADDLFDRLARRKSAEEIALVRATAAVADAGFEAFRASARAGVREYEVVAEVEHAMRMAGADDNFILMSSGPHNRAMRAPTDRRLEPGDIVIGEITPACQGQFIQICRTVSVGEPGRTLVEKYDLLVRAYDAALARVRPGLPASSIANAMDDLLGAAGYAAYCRPPYMRTRGHGFGVGSVAPGAVIDAGTAPPFVEDQVVVVHPNQYLPETGYLACGDTVLVAAAGAERLARSANALYVNQG